MKIGIIGAGEIGATLVRQYTKAGHQVKVTNATGPEKLKALVVETGASAVMLKDVVKDVDVIVLSIPFIGVTALPKDLFKNVPANIPVVDTCNYYPIVSGSIQAVLDGMPESVWVANQIQRPVIKTYNSIFYRSLLHSGLPKGAPSRIALPISGDDKQAKDVVSILVNDSGFDSLDCGSLQDSWRQQPGSPVYCTDLTLAQLKNSIGAAKKELLPQRRELGLKSIISLGPEKWQELVEINRKVYESRL
jgi:8-hydroxy-5-deazaflavin:NADPH oxidoreductase